jgi:HSP20 family protein
MALLRRESFGDLFREMNRFHNEMNQLFGRFGVANGRNRQPGGPALNVWEDENAVYVETDLPGVPADKLDVSVTEGNQLTIQGERPAPEVANAVWHRQERGSGTFTRAVTLPTLVNADKVEARFEQGVLKLTLPKAEAAKPRKIAVKAAE